MKTKSFIEILHTETGKKEIIWEDSDIIEAPN